MGDIIKYMMLFSCENKNMSKRTHVTGDTHHVSEGENTVIKVTILLLT